MSKNNATPALNRKQFSRAERERRMRRYVLIGTGVVTALLVLILGYALVDTLVLQPGQPVARVGTETITTSEFQRAVRFRRYQLVDNYLSGLSFLQANPQFQQFFESQLQQIATQLSDPTTLGRTVLNELIDDRLIRQEAARRGITVGAAELDASIQSSYGFFPNGEPSATLTPTELPTYVPPTVNPAVVAAWTPTATLTPTATFTPTATATAGPSETPAPTETPFPTATPLSTQAFGEVYATRIASIRTTADVDEALVRYFAEAGLYREKLLAALTADVPATEEQVHARHILVDEEALINELQGRLQAGEDWDALAAQYSKDTSNASQGGDLGWFGPGQMVAEFETVAFSTTVGAISAPVKSQFGWHLIQVLEKGPRPLTSTQLDEKRQTAFETWLSDQRQVTGSDAKLLVETFDVWIERVPTTPALPTGATTAP